jgi:hypothetical protein
MIGALISAYLHISEDVPLDTNIAELKFGVTNRILEHANTPAA